MQGRFVDNLGRVYGLYTGGFLVFIILMAILEQLGVSDCFRGVLCSSETGAAKPDARIFAAACQLLNTEPAQTLHAGDSRSADLLGARAAGLGAVWVRRDAQPDPAEDAISDLSALPQLAFAGT